MNKKDIKKLVEGRLNTDDKKKVIEFLLKNPSSRKEYHKIKAAHVAASMRRENSGTVQDLEKNNSIRQLYKYAAAIALFIALLGYALKTFDSDSAVSSMKLVATAHAQNKNVVLPDGTMVTINSNTRLSYPSKFTGVTREVVLEGEAFFDVVENEEVPFIVKTHAGMDIKVLGTTFNVKSYPEDARIETTLVTGKVEVVERNDNKTVFLYPSQRATYMKGDDKLIIDKVNTEKYVSWKDGKLMYNETPMSEVISGLERMYNVTFEINSKELLKYKYNGVFDNLSLEEAINLLELSSPIKCTINKNHVKLTKQE